MHLIKTRNGNYCINSLFLSCLYDIPMKIAAKSLGISSNTLKLICRKEGIAVWPCNEIYQERHPTINRRDVYSGRESMLAQFKTGLDSGRNERASQIYYNVLLAVKQAAENYNLYRGNRPHEELFNTSPAPALQSTPPTPCQKPHQKAQASTPTKTVSSKPNITLSTNAKPPTTVQNANPSTAPCTAPCTISDTNSDISGTNPSTNPSTNRVDALIAAIEGVRTRRIERETELIRAELDAASWPIASGDTDQFLNSLNVCDAMKQDSERELEELSLGPVPMLALSCLFF